MQFDDPVGGGPSTAWLHYTYTLDAVGNITQIHDANDATFNRDFATTI